MISFSQFTQEIDPTIIKRGKSYFRDGRVCEFTGIDEGEYSALVEGSETYQVTIEIRNDMIQDHHCDCPYDAGPICKHEVAVLYAIEQHRSGEPRADVVDTQQMKRKSKTVRPNIESIVRSLSREDMEQMIIDHANVDRERNCKNTINKILYYCVCGIGFRHANSILKLPVLNEECYQIVISFQIVEEF